MYQVQRLQRERWEAELIHDELKHKRRMLRNELDYQKENGLATIEWEALKREVDELENRMKLTELEMSRLAEDMRRSRAEQYERLSEKGKMQAMDLVAIVLAEPENETSHYAQILGCSVARVRFLAHALAWQGWLRLVRHSRWNGWHYLKYYHLSVPSTDDADLPF